jgi:DNA (cytosine-5)-methyltransferase 1
MRYIDLFAGAGGLSEGFIREGFEPIAHVEMNADACSTIKTRLAYYSLKNKGMLNIYEKYLKSEITRNELYEYLPESELNSVINLEISDTTIENIFSQIDKLNQGKKVDLIIGGPPCQAYSVIGRARDKNKMVGDTRNHLFLQYANFLEKYEPKAFVFENVTGLVTAGEGIYLREMLYKFNSLGYKVNIHLEKTKNNKKVDIFNTSDYGVLQSRKRIIIVGYKNTIDFEFDLSEFQIDTKKFNVKDDLLADLPSLQPNEAKKIAFYNKNSTEYQQLSLLRDNDFDFTTQHIARPHNSRDLEIYEIAIKLWLDERRRRLSYANLRADLKTHKNQEVFSNRFQVVNPFGVTHTVVAHISCDGHYYIYPDLSQIRSISVREAARIQSFPDNYFFEGSRTSIFKQIGNAVPPMFAQQIAKAVKNGFKLQLLEYGEQTIRTIHEPTIA